MNWSVADLIDSSVRRVDYHTLHEAIAEWDIMGGKAIPEAFDIFRSAPAMGRNLVMGSQNTYL